MVRWRQQLDGDAPEEIGIVEDHGEPLGLPGVDARRAREVYDHHVGAILAKRGEESVVHGRPLRVEAPHDAPGALLEVGLAGDLLFYLPELLREGAQGPEVDEVDAPGLPLDLRARLAHGGDGAPPASTRQRLGLPEQGVQVPDEGDGGEERVPRPAALLPGPRGSPRFEDHRDPARAQRRRAEPRLDGRVLDQPEEELREGRREDELHLVKRKGRAQAAPRASAEGDVFE